MVSYGVVVFIERSLLPAHRTTSHHIKGQNGRVVYHYPLSSSWIPLSDQFPCKKPTLAYCIKLETLLLGYTYIPYERRIRNL